jgi:hypothetical protein
MPDAETLHASVKEAENGLLKIEWTFKGLPVVMPYFIRKNFIETFATKTRRALQRLVDRYVQIDRENHQVDPPGPRSAYRAGAELKELAAAGYDLYQAFFTADTNTADAEKMRTWLAGQHQAKRPLQISLSIDSRIYVPWGLIYDSDPENLTGTPDNDDIERFRDFWCLKHKLSSVYNRVLLIGIDESLPAAPVNLLSVIDKSVYERVREKWNQHSSSPEDKSSLDSRSRIMTWLNDSFEKSQVHTSEDFFNRWKSDAESLRLIYFYCHANGSNIALGDDLIDANHFALNTQLREAMRSRSSCVVFFNGCDTALGDPEGGFLEATGKSAFCGFIGTETKVPDIFAFRFGLDFLYYFLGKGWPVDRAMDYLRNQHWPLGLIYSTYCPSFLRLGPTDDPLALELTGNFSRIPLLVAGASL